MFKIQTYSSLLIIQSYSYALNFFSFWRHSFQFFTAFELPVEHTCLSCNLTCAVFLFKVLSFRSRLCFAIFFSLYKPCHTWTRDSPTLFINFYCGSYLLVLKTQLSQTSSNTFRNFFFKYQQKWLIIFLYIQNLIEHYEKDDGRLPKLGIKH